MKRFCIKCDANKVEFFEIIKENNNGFVIRLTRIHDGYEKTTEEFMTKELFEMCLKTGFIYAMKETATSVA